MIGGGGTTRARARPDERTETEIDRWSGIDTTTTAAPDPTCAGHLRSLGRGRPRADKPLQATTTTMRRHGLRSANGIDGYGTRTHVGKCLVARNGGGIESDFWDVLVCALCLSMQGCWRAPPGPVFVCTIHLLKRRCLLQRSPFFVPVYMPIVFPTLHYSRFISRSVTFSCISWATGSDKTSARHGPDDPASYCRFIYRLLRRSHWSCHHHPFNVVTE